MIRSLTLRNFKSFDQQSLDFAALTMLSGLNGSGKSSVLHALLLLRQSHEQGLLQARGLALNGDLVQIGTAYDALYEGAEEEVIGIGLGWQDGARGDWRFAYDREADVLDLVSPPVDPVIFAASPFGSEFQHLQAERVGPRPSFEMSDFAVRQRRQVGSSGEYAAYFLAVFGREPIPNTELAHERAASVGLQDQVEAWLGEVAPGVRLHVTPHPNMDLVNLEYSHGQQSNRFRSTNVGFGLTYTLSVLVALLSAGTGALLLLENPEAHLHPQGQSRIGRLIAGAAKGGVQVVVETHSDHVLNGIRIAVHDGDLDSTRVRLHFFSRAEREGAFTTQVASPRIDMHGRIDSWPDGFFDEWDRSLEALLEPGVA